ncbi:MAG: hypothetical protein ACRDRO_10160 [Pseudonocardiaceae bacterium]
MSRKAMYWTAAAVGAVAVLGMLVAVLRGYWRNPLGLPTSGSEPHRECRNQVRDTRVG